MYRKMFLFQCCYFYYYLFVVQYSLGTIVGNHGPIVLCLVQIHNKALKYLV